MGYATCHWCHVMAEESFADPEIAALIDQRFVPVVIDREERPDLDQIYLDAVRRLSGQSVGWPLLVVLGPDGVPLAGTSYLPPRDGDRGVERGLLTVLGGFADRWRDDRAALLGGGADLARDLQSRQGPPPSVQETLASMEARATDRLVAMEDREHGGFGRGQKFPRPSTLAWMVEAGARGDPRAGAVAARMADALRHGAIHDPLAGGFHRYTVDPAWRVPHFEKMLTDNAQLARVWIAAGDGATARETLDFLRSLRRPDGALASALDADAQGPDGRRVEGASYLWTADEVRAVLGERADGAIAALDLGETPAAPRMVGELATADRERLLAARDRRPPPAVDDKAVVAWQGAAISAFARAAALDPAAREDGRALAEVVLRATDEGRRVRRTLDPDAPPPVLDDVAGLAEGLLDLFQATAEPRWLDAALAQLEDADARFGSPDGGWARTPTETRVTLYRPDADEDGPEPAAAAVVTDALVTAAELTGDERLASRARRAWSAARPHVADAPASHLRWLGVGRRLQDGPLELVVVWPDGTDGGTLREAAEQARVPGAVRLAVPASTAATLAERIPLLADRDAVDVPTAWVCRAGICRAPATSPDALAAALIEAQAPVTAAGDAGSPGAR